MAYITNVRQGEYRLVDTVQIFQVENKNIMFDIKDNTKDIAVVRMEFIQDSENTEMRIEPSYPENNLTVLRFIN